MFKFKKEAKTMEYLYENVAYLKGLADGLSVGEETKEGKVLIKIIETLEDFAHVIVELDEDTEEIAEYIEAMDEDLTNIEDDLYEFEDEDEDEDEENIEFIAIQCPNCHEDVYLDEDLLDEDDIDIICPRCHESVDFKKMEDCCNHNDK